ncbi:unnamed protein product [Larinioides sclopetarius]|uniref:Uncharacterized protein n=1 Tax=Larinioides sclopetarius TaxID=280406 RepID=A0AAV1ZHF0_9ARAC
MGIRLEKNNLFSQDIETLTFMLSRLSIQNEQQIELCLKEAFDSKAPQKNTESSTSIGLLFIYKLSRFIGNTIKYLVTCFSFLFFMYLFIISHNSAQKFVMRNCQNFIYPTMRSLRLWTLPILRKYEFLSDWHEEECLLKNPFYYELPLDCWPCEDIRTLVDLTGFPNYSSNYVFNEQPFIVRDSLQRIVSFKDLKTLYKDYNLALDQGTARFLCSEKDFCSPRDVFSEKSASRNSFQVMCH